MEISKSIKKIFGSKIAFTLIVVIFILIFSLMLWGTYSDSRDITLKSEEQSMLNQLYYVSDAINYYFYDMKNDLELLSYTIYENEENMERLIRNFEFKQQVTVKSVTLIDESDRVIYNGDIDFDEEVYDQIIDDSILAMRNIITPAEKSTKVNIYYIEENEYVVAFGVKSSPKEGKQKKVIITISLNDIYEKVISPHEIPVESHPTIKDKEGNILLHYNKDFIGKNAVEENIDIYEETSGSGFDKVLGDQLTGKVDAQIYDSVYEENGVKVYKKLITAYMPLYFLDDYWIISMTWDYDEVSSSIMNINVRLILYATLITLTFGIMMAAIYYLMNNKLRLEKEAQQLRDYNFVLEDLQNRETLMTKNTKYRAMGYMTMGIVHELNNLLTPIIGLTELLKDQIGKDEEIGIRKDELDVIDESANQSKDLLQEILLIGRKDKAYAVFRDFDLRDALNRSIKVIEASLVKKINVHTFICDEPVYVYGNKSQLVQVFINLGINSVQAMSDGGELNFTLRLSEGSVNRENSRLSNTTCVEIIIEDNGMGMDEEVLNKIFQPFYTTKEETKGTGLGLSVVADIIRKHKGEIFIDSTVGKGTSAFIYLPLLNLISEKSSYHKQQDKVNSKDLKICIVNCGEELSESIEEALIEYDVNKYVSSTTYCAMISSLRLIPDVLIISNSGEVIEELQIASMTQRLNPDVKIIYLLDELKEAPHESSSFYIDVVLRTPFKYNDLPEIINGLIE